MTYQMTYAQTSPPMTEGVGSTVGLPEFQVALLASLKQWLPGDLEVKDLSGEEQVLDDQGNVTRPAFYGPNTAAAVYQLKFWLGYAQGRSNGTAGPQLQGYVYHTRRRTPAMYAQRALRLRRRENGKRLKALAIAKSQIGKKESPPNSNRILYSEWYGLVGPWCAMFQTWCATQAGQQWASRGHRYALVQDMDNAAAAHKYGLSFTSSPVPGDLVTYDWEHNGTSDHVGIFEHWTGAGVFTAIEGNTAIGNDNNGGEVMRRTRYRSEVHHFIRVVG